MSSSQSILSAEVWKGMEGCQSRSTEVSPWWRWAPRCSEQEWTVSTGRGHSGCVTVPQFLLHWCVHTEDCTERFKVWLSWYPLKCKSAEEDSQHRATPVCDLRGIWYTQLLSGDNCLFHLPGMSEVPLVIVVSESKANIGVVCLQP